MHYALSSTQTFVIHVAQLVECCVLIMQQSCIQSQKTCIEHELANILAYTKFINVFFFFLQFESRGNSRCRGPSKKSTQCV